MKYKCLLIIYFFFIFSANANDPDDSIFCSARLAFRAKAGISEAKKWKRLASLNQQLRDSEQKRNSSFNFRICTKLFEEYKSFQYDSAFKYTNKMLQLAFVLNDKRK